MRVARVIGVIGRVLVVTGLLLLFYTAYLLWGTNVYTRKAQSDLAHKLAQNPIVTNRALAPGDIPPARPAEKPKPGDPLFTIVVPKIGLKTVVVEGVGREDLKKGPGHFVDRPWPGEDGNVPISGHRTTFGAPFYRLDELSEGDLIAIESGPARYRYTVTEKRIVSPTQVDVVDNRGTNEITLTTCHPRFSASQRLIIHGRYDGPELIAAPPAARPGRPASTAEEPTLVPAPPPAVPRDALVLLFVAIAAMLGAMALSDRLRVAAAWTALVLVAGVGLWTSVFPQILRLMPANY